MTLFFFHGFNIQRHGFSMLSVFIWTYIKIMAKADLWDEYNNNYNIKNK